VRTVGSKVVFQGETVSAIDYYAGTDMSLELSSVCILDGTGQIVREAKVASEPEVLSTFLARVNLPLTRVGLEAGRLSQCCRPVSSSCCWRLGM
jgi:hypothetical protein